MEQKNCCLDKVKIVVLDEADRMLDIGFLPQIKKILQAVPAKRQTLLFSATMPTAIAQIASTYMKSPLRIEVAPAGTPAAHIEQHVFYTLNDSKMQLLDKLLADYGGTILVFSRTKHGAKKIAREIRAMGHASAEIHSNLSPAQRRDALTGFKSGKYRILVATDIASRGIDVNDIALVINYDLPDNNDDYVHRIGRTGRAGKPGKAISFAAPSQWPDIRDIEKLIRKKIAVADTPVLPPKRPRVMPRFDEERVSFRGGRHDYGSRRKTGHSRPGNGSRPAGKIKPRGGSARHKK
jgi:ATP-dependent RNA helicase RhlE